MWTREWKTKKWEKEFRSTTLYKCRERARWLVHPEHSAIFDVEHTIPTETKTAAHKNVNNCFNFILPFDPSSAAFVLLCALFRRWIFRFHIPFHRSKWNWIRIFFTLVSRFVVISCKYGNFQFMSIAVLFTVSLFFHGSDRATFARRRERDEKIPGDEKCEVNAK